MDQLQFETIPAESVSGLGTKDATVQRAQVPGGWIVLYDGAKQVKFCPQPTAPRDAKRVGLGLPPCRVGGMT